MVAPPPPAPPTCLMMAWISCVISFSGLSGNGLPFGGSAHGAGVEGLGAGVNAWSVSAALHRERLLYKVQQVAA